MQTASIDHEYFLPSCCIAKDLTKESVALVAGGAILGFDDRIHIDLDRSHTVLTPDEARQFSAELKKIADEIEPFPDLD